MAIYWGYQETVHTRYDDVSRLAREYEPGGIVLIQERPFTAAENAIADAMATTLAEAANKATIEQALSDALVEVQTIIDATNATINANAASYIKILARAARRIIRLLIRRFDGTA